MYSILVDIVNEINECSQFVTGPSSYKEHAHRMITIWFEGLAPEVNATKILCESLAAINKKSLGGQSNPLINLRLLSVKIGQRSNSCLKNTVATNLYCIY